MRRTRSGRSIVGRHSSSNPSPSSNIVVDALSRLWQCGTTRSSLLALWRRPTSSLQARRKVGHPLEVLQAQARTAANTHVVITITIIPTVGRGMCTVTAVTVLRCRLIQMGHCTHRVLDQSLRMGAHPLSTCSRPRQPNQRCCPLTAAPQRLQQPQWTSTLPSHSSKCGWQQRQRRQLLLQR